MMTPEAIARATWHENSYNTMILKCCVKDGSAVLATITKIHHFSWRWQLTDGIEHRGAPTRHTTMRRVREALQ